MEASETKVVTVDLLETKVMVIIDITKNGLYKSKPYLQCDICGLMVKVNSVVCVKFGNWIYSR